MDMSLQQPAAKPAITVALITVLHALTHALQMLLIPLYLMIQKDLHLAGVNQVALIVTLYNLVYFSASFFAGILADRFNRRNILGIGLLGNALAILLMGTTHRYELLIALGVLAGLFGTLFHPAANALAAAHYPRHPGMVIGIIGIGAGIGFFIGPRFAGWRAEVAGWERPLVEAGLVGLVIGAAFLIFAREAPGRRVAGAGDAGEVAAPRSEGVAASSVQMPLLSSRLRWRVVAAAMILGWRDFAAVGVTTLASLYLQQAQGRGVRETGLILGTMTLSGVIINPLAVWASPRKRRLPALLGTLLLGGVLLATVPRAGRSWTLLILAAQQACSLASFALGDAAMLERISPLVRGRVMGLFMTLAGTLGSAAAWVMGAWVDKMGESRHVASAYIWPFSLAGGLMIFASFSLPLISRFGPRDAEEASEGDAERRAMMSGEI